MLELGQHKGGFFDNMIKRTFKVMKGHVRILSNHEL